MFKGVIGSAAIVFGLACTMFVAEAWARRMICEEWRDYYYNVHTGDFIGWAGEPYWECWYMDEPVSRPTGNHPHPHYDGGWGIPRDPARPTCSECTRAHGTCEERAWEGTEACIRHNQRWARSWCERMKTDIDNRLIVDYTCTSIDQPRGRPRQVCYGEGIDRCVESFEYGSPDRTSDTGGSFSLNIRNWFTIGEDERSSVTWGGRRGFRDACREAEQVAFLECQVQFDECTARAGGCS